MTNANCMISQNNHPSFNAYCVSVHRPSDYICEEFSVVIEAEYASRPQRYRHWQIFGHARLLLMVQTCNNPTDLGRDYMGGGGGVGVVQIAAT
jgi:hypothetical protein